MGIPEYEAKCYEGRVKDGGILLSVHCDDSDGVSKAKVILKHLGAEDIHPLGNRRLAPTVLIPLTEMRLQDRSITTSRRTTKRPKTIQHRLTAY